MYGRLELHVGAEIALNFENVVCVRTYAHASKCSFINCTPNSAVVAQWVKRSLAATAMQMSWVRIPLRQLFTREITFYMSSYLLLEK